MDLKSLRIGYLPYSQNFEHPGDKRRFIYYAKKRGISFEIADPSKKYDILVLTQNADLSIWHNYDIGGAKIIYDLIDSYLLIPKNEFKGNLRGLAKYFAGKSKYLKLNHWSAIEEMCFRSDAVICSTNEQSYRIMPFCSNVHKILDVHKSVSYKVKSDFTSGNVFNIVWEGLPGNLYAFNLFKEVFKNLEKKYEIALHFVTDLNYFRYLDKYGKSNSMRIVENLTKRTYFYQWNELTCAEIITKCDLAIIPVDLNNQLVKGKPENKLLLFWRMGIPTITSSTPAYKRAMLTAGLDMSCSDKKEWFSKIEEYILDEKARRRAGLNGLKTSKLNYSSSEIVKQWDNVFNSIKGDDYSNSYLNDFTLNKKENIDYKTVEGFGEEWYRFNQSKLSSEELNKTFQLYFSIFPWNMLSKDSIGFDLGCGSGRWAKLVAPKVKKLHCIDPSAAINIAKLNLSNLSNCDFHNTSVDNIPLENGTMDFGYSLGVLHHIPDPKAGLKSCVDKLKRGAPFLLYLYYDFDNRKSWYRVLWSFTDVMRKVISHLPSFYRYWICQTIALVVYFPLARIALIVDKLGFDNKSFPLNIYSNLSFYLMRTDALDRFGTRLEKRFSKNEIKQLMVDSGLENICFSEVQPFWCAVGYRK